MIIDQIDHRSGDAVADVRPATRRRATTYAYLAAVWSLLYGGLASGWAVGVPGWPRAPFERVGTDMPPALASVLPPHLLVAMALVGAGAGIAMANGWGRSVIRRTLLGAAWLTAAGLAFAFTTERVLILVGYAPIYLIGAPFGWPPDNFFDHVTWPVVHEAICLVGAGLWALTAVWYRRRTAGVLHGDGTVAGSHHARAHLLRDGVAVAVAVAVPALYALTRYAWLLGVPLGISEEFLREGQQTGMWVTGAGLATFAMVGAVLTLGLVMRWGEVLPDWIPLVGGRRVPTALATVPATVVSVLLTGAGLALWRQYLADPIVLDGVMWGAHAPTMLLPVWGVALGVATLAYRRRRSSTDAHTA